MKTHIKSLEIDKIREIATEAKYVVIDENVSSYFNFLDSQNVYVVKNVEASKNWNEVEKVCDYFLDQEITREDSLLAIGGGALSDLAGFCASILKRGISWSIIPTTVLAQVDASIGGKVGINTTQGKNQIGQFHFPQTVYLNSDFFKTLPESDYESGMGEVLKYKYLSKEIFQSKDIGEVFKKCCDYKLDVVHKDPFEENLRKVLNFGHTLGHAFEKYCHISHGAAVKFGIIAIQKAYALNVIEEIQLPKIENFEDFFAYVLNDKKRTGNELDIILVPDIGSPEIKRVNIEDFKQRVRNVLC